MELTKVLDGTWYVLYLAIVMIFAAWAKKTNFFMPFYRFIAKNVKSKRAVVAIISAISGVLPIEGRVTVSAGFLDTIAPNNERRKMFGIIDYLSTHHYYFWSPLEKTVILPMAVLGLGYSGFIMAVWPLIITCLAVAFFYIFFVLKEEDVAIDLEKKTECKCNDHIKWVNWKLLLGVAGVIILGNYLKTFDKQMFAIVKDNETVAVALALSFLFSFAMGSSGKYAGFVSLLCTIFGVKFLPLFLAVDYTAYMISPTHKCFMVGKEYFDTPVAEFYKSIGILCGCLILVSLLMVLL